MTVLLGKVTGIWAAFMCLHICAPPRTCAQGAHVCAGCCASMGMSDGHGIHAKHTGEGCSRCAPYMHVTVHIHAQERVPTQTHRGQPHGGMRKDFVGRMCFSVGHCFYFSKVGMHRDVGGHGFAWPLRVCVGWYVFLCMYVHGHVHMRSTPAVSFSCVFSVYPSHLWVCACFLVRVCCCRALVWVAAGSSMILRVCVGPGPHVCV